MSFKDLKIFVGKFYTADVTKRELNIENFYLLTSLLEPIYSFQFAEFFHNILQKQEVYA